MKTGFLVILGILASVVFSASAASPTTASAARAQSPRSFVATAEVAVPPSSAPTLRAATYSPPCTRSSFTELGRGHGDVAGAGHASAFCPSYSQTADAGDSNAGN